MPEFLELEQFPIKTDDKIRYADTDRQGHGINAIFAITIEQGLFQDKTRVATANTVIVQMRDDEKRSEPLNELTMSIPNGLM